MAYDTSGSQELAIYTAISLEILCRKLALCG